MSERTIFRASKRVGLGLIMEEDIPFLLANMNDIDLTMYLAHGRFPIGRKAEQEWVESLYPKGVPTNLGFMVLMLPEKEAVGCMGLHSIDLLSGTAVTGAWLTKKAQGKKIGREAKMILLRYAFVELGLRTLKSSVIAYNERSYRYNIASGYIEIGRTKDWDRNPMTGKFADEILMQIMREDWLPLYEKWCCEEEKDES
jgi:RimJ/RimL family protein N-acetyltransferase